MAKKRVGKRKTIKSMSAKNLEAMINKKLKKTKKNKDKDNFARRLGIVTDGVFLGYLGAKIAGN